MNRVSSIIHLDYARQHGLTGQGIGVAILDTWNTHYRHFDR